MFSLVFLGIARTKTSFWVNYIFWVNCVCAEKMKTKGFFLCLASRFFSLFFPLHTIYLETHFHSCDTQKHKAKHFLSFQSLILKSSHLSPQESRSRTCRPVQKSQTVKILLRGLSIQHQHPIFFFFIYFLIFFYFHSLCLQN